MRLSQIEEHLESSAFRGNSEIELDEAVTLALAQIKARAIESDDQETAKYIWCLEAILGIHKNYKTAFKQMKDGEYYSGWCTLERVEIAILTLEKHLDVKADNDRFKINFIKKHVEQFQSIYPYKAFVSPGILKLKSQCSICGRLISLRNHCGHIPGEIYDGKLCSREVTEAVVLEISVVPNPVQKYSVLFLSDSSTGKQVDHYNYSHVRYVVNGLRSPFDAWTMRWTKLRHPHSLFRETRRNDLCPCNSGKKYKNCCLKEIGVLMPHLEIEFAVPPPSDYPRFEYAF